MATSDKLQAILNSKEAIRTAINDKGVVVEETDALSLYASKIEEITTGGSDEEDVLRYINWYDADGTLLKAEVLHQGELATPPTDPHYDSEVLMFDGWTSPFDYSGDTEHDNDIGAMYKPRDGNTHITVAFSEDAYTMGLTFQKYRNNMITIDWGDGSEIVTSMEIDSFVNHTYELAGVYEIKAGFSKDELINYSFGFGNSTNQQMFTGTGNSKIIKLYLADQFIKIKDYEFSYTSMMEVATIGRSVVYVGERSFLSASYLSIVILPSTITSVPSKVFQNCTFLQHIVFPDCRASSEYIWYGCKALINIVFSEKQIGIGRYAFQNCMSLKRVSTTKSLTSIGSSAFDSDSSLTIVTDTSSCVTFSSSAFKNCRSLVSIDLSAAKSIYYYCFQGCKNLKTVNIGPSLNKISNNLFDSCYSLESVYFTDSIKIIEHGAFSNCYALSYISSLEQVTNIGYSAFLGCSSLRLAVVNGFISYTKGMFQGCVSLEKGSIPEDVGALDSYFSNCHNLKNVYLPLGITTMTNQTFYNCYNLRNVAIAKDFDCSIMMNDSPLSRVSLLNIAENIKNNKGLTVKKINVQTQVIEIIKSMQIIDAANGTIREATTNENGRISLIEYITNKNWTVY